ncbi:hypothetical protein BaRGS_00026809 [Batillaria attramentaria]|uniref:THAP-type domain-containing protein n=1 Tax=Batillaria attramentaria TaxID=370345 RepID=A0ABD0K4P7_9CAEN
MPGRNCAVVGCSACQNRNRGLSFFRIRRPKNPEWESALVRAVNRCDASFNKDNASICSRHFKEECFQSGGKTGRILKEGSLPTEFMPVKSIVTPVIPARKPPAPRAAAEAPQRVHFYSFSEVRKAATDNLPAPWILVSSTEEQVVCGIVTEDFNSMKLKVTIERDFVARVQAIGLPARGYTSDIESTGLNSLLKSLFKKHVCPGVTEPEMQNLAGFPTGDGNKRYFRHVSYEVDGGAVGHKSTVRSTMCQLLLEESGVVCSQCRYTRTLLRGKLDRAAKAAKKPVSRHHPLHSMPSKTLVKELKATRKQNTDLQRELSKFKASLHNDSVEVPPTLHASMLSVMNTGKIDNPLQKLFWEEQCKAFNAGSKAEALQHMTHCVKQGFYICLVNLHCETTQMFFIPNQAFRIYMIVDEIKRAAEKFEDNQRFVVLLHDEMAIKSDQVFDKHSGELVGFVNATGSHEETVLATHALVFYVVGINTSLSSSLGFFGTQTVTADVLYPLFWKAVGLLETACNLKVIACTSDKATPNQRLYDLHGDGRDVCYKTKNLFALDREIYFFSDVPHLIKTVRNNLSNSGGGKRTRHLWLNGKHLLWSHIIDIYDRDVAGQLRRTKLTHDHVYLTPASVMNVKLAAQVLSYSVGKIMQEYGGPDCQETARFILLMDRFFDCLNTRSLTEGTNRRKNDLLPYRHVDDARFDFLAEFLDFFDTVEKCYCSASWQFHQN